MKHEDRGHVFETELSGIFHRSEASEMCENYARSLLRVSVAQICQALGWDAVQLTACDLLSDVLHRYIQQLAKVCHRYSELCKFSVSYSDYFLLLQ